MDVVRGELLELEELMMRFATAKNCSFVVQFQSEINQFQTMLNSTLGRIEQIEKYVLA